MKRPKAGMIGGVMSLVRGTLAKSRNSDVIYVNTQRAMVVGAIAGLISRRPVVWHLRDIVSQEHFGKTQLTIIKWCTKLMLERVIANSTASAVALTALTRMKEERLDVVFNGIGSVVGAAAGIAWDELSVKLSGASGNRGRSDRGGVFVVLLWLLWRLWPFIPQFSIGMLKAAFQPLTDPFFSVAATLHYLVWWTLLAHIVFTLIGGQRGIEAMLALIAIVLAGCLFITHHGFVPSELLALVLLLPALLVLNRLAPAPRMS